MKNEIGQSLSFYEMMKGNNIKVEIPIIQRDYAQGRESAKDIRTHFLATIKNHLEESKPMNLDFIFGSKEDGKFIPLDGQQRLTTLFLLHWYLAWASEQTESIKDYLGTETSNFTYETRISSRYFCNAIVSQSLPYQDGIAISKLIKDQPWFYLNWQFDATITGMLNSLDTIQEEFSNPTFYYEQLTRKDPPLISFEYIELKDFGLSDQLYIKMNSRGKPLTEFENMKANVEQIYEDYDKAHGTDHTFWFTSKIDGVWTDLFWSFLPDKSMLIDTSFVNFLRVSLANYYALLDSEEEHKLKLEFLLSPKLTINYYVIELIGLALFDPFYNAFQELDILTDEAGDLVNVIEEKELINVKKLFESVTNHSISLPKRVQFFALCKLMIEEKSPDVIKESMRIVRNLSENSRIEDETHLINALKSTNTLLDHADDIMNFLLNEEDLVLSGFSKEQRDEEIIKAYILQNLPNWEGRIKSLENHPYLQGNIQFMLIFCGIFSIIKDIDPVDAKEEQKCLNAFDEYLAKFESIFQEDGIKNFEDFLFERALFTIGDYLLFKNSNYSFVINGNDRDISWKRLLKSDNRKYLKELFDQVDIDNVGQSLQSLVDEYDDDTDYRFFFIKYPEILAMTGSNKYIRWKSDNDILLLEKTQTNGTHREYYSFAIYCELKARGYKVTYQPNSYIDYGNKYINSINGKEIRIYYYPDGDEEGYWIESSLFDEEEQWFKLHEEVIEFIEDYFSKS